MSGMVLADEGMRLEFPGAQHGQATRTTPAGARGRRTARGTTSSTSLGNNVNVNQHQPIHPSHPTTPSHDAKRPGNEHEYESRDVPGRLGHVCARFSPCWDDDKYGDGS
jgi:hypothetical protein